MMRLLQSLLGIGSVTLATSHAADLTAIPFETIQGDKTSLADYKGKVVLVVNTASRCGLTEQYAALEGLQDKYGKQGFTVIAFPCNDFGKQEPGSHEEIQEFCETKFAVSFPLMAKISVKGENQHPLYTALTGKDGVFPGKVTWNFGKFLIGKDGKAIARFEPRQKPDSPEIVEAIEKALAAK
ncbi:MAG: glutathione peroxidase [Akkermansiaceae bacterium]|nr:glutathione peroxidase [Akkermansiaceae bacterium]